MRRRFALFSLPLALFPGFGVARARTRCEDIDAADDLATLRKELDELKRSFGEFKTSTARKAGLISNLSRTSPPVGTVVAFAGPWPPKDSQGKQWTEHELGWLLCDGRSLQESMYDELAAVLGKRKLPDLRACFLRGVDRGMDGSTTGRDADGVRQVGADQKASTAAPVNPKFSVSEVPEQKLTMAGRYLLQTAKAPDGAQAVDPKGPGFPGWPDLTHIFDPDFRVPRHSHTLSEWDTETRPINVAVCWIVKFK